MWKKVLACGLGILLGASLLVGCGGKDGSSGEGQSGSQGSVQESDGQSDTQGSAQSGEEEGTENVPSGEVSSKNYQKVTVDVNTTYQTMESFGTSGAWWSQYVGGFENVVDDSGESSRERIAELLFDREKGIGLTCYRFNVGAGSADSRNGSYSDIHRRAQSFESEAGVYDWEKDANAVWMLKRAVELGVEEVVFFCNSPLERLTDNGKAHLDAGMKSNISPENYGAFADYVCDVAEHFLGEGIPVKFISPINEPQWDWTGGQEGAHYEPAQTTDIYLAFLDELESREALADVKLSGPESGEWGGQAIAYTDALLKNERLAAHFDTIDNHSYWSDETSKKAYRNYMKVYYPDVKLRMSEWCEMVNGSDLTMDSAYHLAQQIAEDLRILNVVSWQNWVAVAPGGYRDGLIYIDEPTQKFRALKRLWSFGNYSRYVRPGYVRVDIQTETKDYDKMMPTAFTGVNDAGEEELVMVFINEDVVDKEFQLAGCEGYDRIAYYETSDTRDLECVQEGDYTVDLPVVIPKMTVTTVILTKTE